jgi:PKD repeat protein
MSAITGVAISVVLLLALPGLVGGHVYPAPTLSAPQPLRIGSASPAGSALGVACTRVGGPVTPDLACPRTSAASAPQWSNLSSTTHGAPSSRAEPAMSYDPPSGGVILFGGRLGSGAGSAETWEFTFGRWVNLTGSLSLQPPARWGATLAWDPAVGELVLFGGANLNPYGQTQYLNDTWEFTGGSSPGWQQVPTPTAPSPRSEYEMAYDTADGYLLLTGGVGPSGTLGETWTFAGGVWDNVTAAVGGPAPPRAGGMAVYDPNRGAVLVLGGDDPWPGCGAPGAIEQYSHGLWSNVALEGSANLSSLISGGAIFDGDGPFTLVVGGVWSYTAATTPPSSVCVALGVSAGLVGSVASSFSSSAAPPAMESFGFAYYPGGREAVLFGGDILGGSAQLVVPTNQTWAFTLPKVVVSISRTTIYPEANESVNFTGVANRTDGPLTMSWNFGDGTSVANAGPNVSHAYTAAGEYSVILNATDPNGTYATSIVLVSVAAPCRATIEVMPASGAPPLSVTLRAVIFGGYSPYTVTWSLTTSGTTVAGSGNVTTVRLTVAGTYSIRLVVRDFAGYARTFGNSSVAVQSSSSGNGLGGLGSDWTWVLVGATVAVVIVVVGVILWRRNSSSAPPPKPPR